MTFFGCGLYRRRQTLPDPAKRDAGRLYFHRLKTVTFEHYDRTDFVRQCRFVPVRTRDDIQKHLKLTRQMSTSKQSDN